MPPRIAIPMPHSTDLEYAERAIPQYELAVEQAGGQPIRIPLDGTPDEVLQMAEHCDAILLPGSNADVDPVRFGSPRSPHTATRASSTGSGSCARTHSPHTASRAKSGSGLVRRRRLDGGRLVRRRARAPRAAEGWQARAGRAGADRAHHPAIGDSYLAAGFHHW